MVLINHPSMIVKIVARTEDSDLGRKHYIIQRRALSELHDGVYQDRKRGIQIKRDLSMNQSLVTCLD